MAVPGYTDQAAVCGDIIAGRHRTKPGGGPAFTHYSAGAKEVNNSPHQAQGLSAIIEASLSHPPPQKAKFGGHPRAPVREPLHLTPISPSELANRHGRTPQLDGLDPAATGYGQVVV